MPVVRISVEDNTRRFTVRSRSATGGAWVVHAHGRLVEADVDAELISIEPRTDSVEIGVEALYDGMRAHGLAYGRSFRLLHQVWLGGAEVVARLVTSTASGATMTTPRSGWQSSGS